MSTIGGAGERILMDLETTVPKGHEKGVSTYTGLIGKLFKTLGIAQEVQIEGKTEIVGKQSLQKFMFRHMSNEAQASVKNDWHKVAIKDVKDLASYKIKGNFLQNITSTTSTQKDVLNTLKSLKSAGVSIDTDSLASLNTSKPLDNATKIQVLTALLKTNLSKEVRGILETHFKELQLTSGTATTAAASPKTERKAPLGKQIARETLAGLIEAAYKYKTPGGSDIKTSLGQWTGAWSAENSQLQEVFKAARDPNGTVTAEDAQDAMDLIDLAFQQLREKEGNNPDIVPTPKMVEQMSKLRKHLEYLK